LWAARYRRIAPRAFAADETAGLGWQVSRPVGPACGAERLSLEAVHGQRDQVGVADLQLAAFPAGDRVARHAESPAELCLGQTQSPATSAKIGSPHGATGHYTPGINPLTLRCPDECYCCHALSGRSDRESGA
jgi:hypothetical protein